MGNAVPFCCPILDCSLHNEIIYAERQQIRSHIVFKHDYHQWQETAYKNGLTSSIVYRSRGFFINMLCEFGISRGMTK